MQIRDLKISTKLILSFGVVVSVLLIVIAFQTFSIIKLSRLQNNSTALYENSERVLDIDKSMSKVYTEFADIVISRSFTDFDKRMEEIKSKYEEDIRFLEMNAQDEEKKKKVESFKSAYKDIVTLLEATVPIVKRVDTTLDTEIMMQSWGMGSQRVSTAEFLHTIKEEYNKEAENAAHSFNTQKNAALTVTLIFTVSAIALCIIMTLLIYRYIVYNINKDVEFARKISTGDLTERLTVYSKDEFGILADALNKSTDNLEKMMKAIHAGMLYLSQAVEEITSGNQNLSQRTTEQASAVEEMAATIEESVAAYMNNLNSANNTLALSNKAAELAKSGGTLVNDAIIMMQDVNSSSHKISEIINLINGIAFQTNLLALNAAVEAARAGEQGRGFAVVAGEVRNLAQRSSEAAKEIGNLIKESVSNAAAGSEKVNSSGATLKEIIGSAMHVNEMISEITALMNEQKAGMDQINLAINNLDSMTQQNAALVEEIASSSEEMMGQAGELNGLISQFTFRDDTSS